MFDILGEILETMRRNKLRTFLTGFAVAWGIFLLIVLLAAGTGLQNGVQSNMAGQATNYINIRPGWTSMPYKGLKADRRIRFDERTIDYVRRNIPEVEYLSGVIFHNTQSVSYGKQYGTWQIIGASPQAVNIHNLTILKGRFVNEIDDGQKRKVAFIHKLAEETLFPHGEESLGKYIVADGISFQIIGVYEWLDGSNDALIFAPLSTAKMLYDRGWGISRIDLTVLGIKNMKQYDEFVLRLRGKLGPLLGFDPADTSALRIWGSARQSIEIGNVFRFVNMFLWVIGFASLMAGIVGVANIMLVTVKERTREIGIRKALGATPWSIIKSVIIEAVFITTAAGYIGILMGIGASELASRVIGSAGEGGMTAFKDPDVGLGVVFSALVVLIICGVVAGLIPSLKATRIRPIEAMRAD